MRLFVRGDLDGIVSAALICKMETVDEILFAHPREIEDGRVKLNEGDGLANLPYSEGAKLWFDHHGKAEEGYMPSGVMGRTGKAPSASRLVYEYYNAPDPGLFGEMMESVDRLDSGNVTFEDILHPQAWMKLGFLLDPRTGMMVSDDLKREIIQLICDGTSIEVILNQNEIKPLYDKYVEEEDAFKRVMTSNTKIKRNVAIVDYRANGRSHCGNRFLVYAIYPRCNFAIRVGTERSDPGCVNISVSKSVFYRHTDLHVGKMLEKYGGGGLSGAGTCTVRAQNADVTVKELIGKMKHVF